MARKTEPDCPRTSLVIDEDDEGQLPAKGRRVWPYAAMLLLAWGLIFGAVFWSHFLSDLPTSTSLVRAPRATLPC
jgi:hypothetical protein